HIIMVAQVLALPPNSKKVMGWIPAWATVGSGGRSSPYTQCSCARRISSAILCGVCMFSPCPQGPQHHTLLSIPDQEGRFTSLGPWALKSCPLLLGSWRKDNPGWACVCVLCHH